MQKDISDPEEGRLDLASTSVSIKQREDVHADTGIKPRAFAVKICLVIFRLGWRENGNKR